MTEGRDRVIPSGPPGELAERGSGLSPRARARLSGLFEALEGFPAVFGQTFVLGRLVVAGSAAATAHNILASEGLYRLGFLIPLLAVGFHIAWAFLIYQLFRVVDRTINAVALLVMLVGCAIQAVAAVIYLAPLLILQSNVGGTLTIPQQQGLAIAFMKLSGAAFNTYLVFFGAWCVLTGYLILRCSFMRRIIGALLIPDGIGWMLYLWPPVATMLFPVIAVISGAAEFSLLLWMLIFGVNNERWWQQAAAAAGATAYFPGRY